MFEKLKKRVVVAATLLLTFCGLQLQAGVAKVGDTEYATLKEAFSKVPSGGTVQLIADVTEGVSVQKSLVLDLNGHTLTGASAKYQGATYEAVMVLTGPEVTITDSSEAGTGKIVASDTGTSLFYLVGHGATLNIAGGEIVNVAQSMVTISPYLIYDDPDAEELVPLYFDLGLNLSVTGGTVDTLRIVNVDEGLLAAGAYTLSVTGGTFGADPSEYLMEDYRADKQPNNYYLVQAKKYIAKIGDTKYETLKDAVEAATDEQTITMIADSSTSLEKQDGIQIPANKFTTGLTIDLGNHTYTCNGSPVGSGSTKNQAFQLLAGNKITFQNGTLNVATDVATDFRFVIQNYSDLTLDNVTVDGTNLKMDGKIHYTVSNNNGTTEIKNGSEIIASKTGDTNFAFDVCRYSTYPSVSVTVNGATINGNVEVSASNNDAASATLSIQNATFGEGATLVIDDSAAGATVTKAAGVTVALDSAHPQWSWNEAGTALTKNVFMIDTAAYATLEAAVAAADAGKTIKIYEAGTYTLPGLPKNITIEGAVAGVVFNCEGSGSIGTIPNGSTIKNVTFEFGTRNYHGWQHAGSMTFENCTLNGLFFSYGGMTFNGCTFNAPGSEYSMWAYAGDLTYNDCVFNFAGKCINVYNEDNTPTPWNVAFNRCKFNSTVKNKAAVNVKAMCGTKELDFNVSLTDCTTDTPDMLPTDKRLGNGLVMVDDGDSEAVTVTVDNVAVYEPLKADSEDGFYHINNLAELNRFRAMVNGEQPFVNKRTFAGKTVKLMDNIDLAPVKNEVANNAANEQESWTPIGEFKGTFDGNGKTIQNLYCVDEGMTKANVGFFGKINGGATVKNLTIENVTLKGMACVGAIAGGSDSAGSTITGCKVLGRINLSSHKRVGGIIGAYYTNISDCQVLGAAGETNVIESIPLNGGDGHTAGGIIGFPGEGQYRITNCTVQNVNISGTERVGGIAGHAYGTVITGCTVDNVKVTKTACAAFDSWQSIGMIAGGDNKSGKNSRIIDCQVLNSVGGSVTAIIGRDGSSGTPPAAADKAMVGTGVVFTENDAQVVSGTFTQFPDNGALVATGSLKYPQGDNVIVAQALQETEGVFQIADLEDLIIFREMVNGGNTFAGKTVKLMNSITFAGDAWDSGIGNGTVKFAGTFDGNGKAITGLKITANQNYVGLFGGVWDAKISNLTLEAPIISNTGTDYTGAIVGAGYANITGCTVTGGSVTGVEQVGGIIGYLSCGSVKNCEVNGVAVKATDSRAGGIVGKANIDSQYEIVGNTVSGGSVVSGDSFVGALVGQIMASANNLWQITDNKILTVPTTANGETVFSPIGQFRDDGSYQANSLTAGHIARNYWEPTATLYVDIYNPAKSAEFLHVPNFIMVAQIGTDKYNTLQEAIAAAEGNLSQIEVLVTGVDVPAGYKITDLADERHGLDWDYTIFNGQGTGTEQDPFQIPSLATLKAFRDLVNYGCTFNGKFVQVTAEQIDLMDANPWTPIGDKEQGKYFKGTFDGNGVKILNMNITSDVYVGEYTAFFSAVGDKDGAANSVTIKNLTVQGTAAGANVAGVVARVDGATVENVTNKVVVTGTKKAGGVACLAQFGATFNSCVNDGEVTTNGSGNNRPAGGIVAIGNAPLTFTDCVNNGAVTLTDATSSYAAGMLGYEQALTGSDTFVRCVNKGAITSPTSDGISAGLVAKFSMSSHVSKTQLFVEDCANYGTLTGKENYSVASISTLR